MTPALIFWLFTCCTQHGVEPDFALAAFQVESQGQCGPLGKGTVYGPAGIHKSFLKKWNIADPYVNVEVGVKALRGRDKLRVLRRYNTASNRAYEAAVMSKYRQLKRKTG